MRHALILCLLSGLLISGCSSCLVSCPTPTSQQIPQDYSGGHSSMNSLDYFGLYRAETVSSGEDIQTIDLAQWGQYRLRTAMGQERTGTYQWDVTGSVIHLEGSNIQFWVGENTLRLVSPGPQEGTWFRK